MAESAAPSTILCGLHILTRVSPPIASFYGWGCELKRVKHVRKDAQGQEVFSSEVGWFSSVRMRSREKSYVSRPLGADRVGSDLKKGSPPSRLNLDHLSV